MSLYHGSNLLIEKFLKPFPSKVINGEEAVFASPYKEFVLAFMGKKWSDKDIELGSYKFKTYIIEKKPGMFKKIYSNQKGYLYEVSKTGFKDDKRLGMQGFEKIKKTKTKIKKMSKIDDVLKELKKSKIIMITYKQLKFIEFSTKCNTYTEFKDNKFNFESLDNLKNKNYCVKSKIVDYKDLRNNLYGDINKKIKLIGFYQLTKTIKLYVILK